MQTFRTALWSCLLFAMGACEPKVAEIQLDIVTRSCVSPGPLEGATHLRVKVMGEDIEPLVAVTPLANSPRSLEVPGIPFGKSRRVEVRAYEGQPDQGGTVLSVGQSASFDVPEAIDESTEPLSLTVVLRRVNLLLPPSAVAAPTTCVRMLSARAGHAATVMADGRVLITGGYQLSAGKRTALYKAEWYNPLTGAFEDAPDVGLLNRDQSFTAVPLAFHSASLLSNGKVLLWGGEEYGAAQEVIPRARKLVFDPASQTYGQIFNEAVNVGRSRHRAVVEKSGKVLVLGGHTRQEGANGTVLESRMEWLEPSNLSTALVSNLVLARLEMGVSSVQNGAFVALAAGYDGASLRDDVLFFEFQGEGFVQADAANSPRLTQARRGVAMAPFRDSNTLLVAGGYTDAFLPKASGKTEVVTTGGTKTVAQGPDIAPRGEMCLAALPDGRVLAVGGRSQDTSGGGLPQSEEDVELVTARENGETTVSTLEAMKTGRYQHTCTVLADGSVLVLGGVTESRGAQTVLQDAYLFVPAPLD